MLKTFLLASGLVLMVPACFSPAAPNSDASGSGPGGMAVAQSVPAWQPGVWVSREELMQRPMTGSAWATVKEHADSTPPPPDLSDQDETTNIVALAKALVFARTGEERYRSDVLLLLRDVVGTNTGRSLALGRKLAAYVIAADLIDLPAYNQTFDALIWRRWLREALIQINTEGRSLQTCHEQRPNNWGAMCGGSRAAVAVYLRDRTELDRVAQVLKGFLGDRSAYVGFDFKIGEDGGDGGGAETWSPLPSSQLVPINPSGSRVNGHNVDGVIVDDQRRTGAFKWPPDFTAYEYGGLGGAVVQAEILHRQGYDTWNWSEQALKRAVEWLADGNDGKASFLLEPAADKLSTLAVIDARYGTTFKPAGATDGRILAWTDWTHTRIRRPCGHFPFPRC